MLLIGLMIASGIVVAPTGADASVGGDGLVAVRAAGGIEVAALDGSRARLIAEGMYASQPSWSANGKKIAYVGDDLQIMVARANGSHARVVSLPSEMGGVHWPSWSPDGRLTYNYGTHTVIVDADGSHRQMLPRAEWLSWTPEGRMVLLRGPPYHLVIGRANGTGFHSITPLNPGGLLPQTDPWQFSTDGLVAFHFADGPTIEEWVEYLSMAGRSTTGFDPGSVFQGGQSVALAPRGDRAVIARGGQLSVWDIDPTTGTQSYERDSFTITASGYGTQVAWQPTCTIRSTTSDTTITGTSGSDLICVTGNDDVVRGRGGNDTIYVTGYQDTVHGGFGRDVLVVHGRANRTYGGPGADVINTRDHTDSRSRGGTGTDVCITDRNDRTRSCMAS